MDRGEAIVLLKRGKDGVLEWNQWRRAAPPDAVPSLRGCQIRDAYLDDAFFWMMDLSEADFTNSSFMNARFQDVRLDNTRFTSAMLGDSTFDYTTLN